MEIIYWLFVIVIFVFGILEIILFFKIWSMTNDVRKIYNVLKYRIAPSSSAVASKATGRPTENQILVNDFYNEARELRDTLLSANDDGQAENIFYEQMSYIADKYQSISDEKEFGLNFKSFCNGLWDILTDNK